MKKYRLGEKKMKIFISPLALAIVMFSVAAMPSLAIGEGAKVGVVLLHGSGHPTKHIEGLARRLESSKFLVVTPEMPWSEKRHYDAPVDDAVDQVNSALGQLKEQGAEKFIIAGHSKGGVFALYYASKYPLDGLVAIAPGGNVGGKNFRNKLGSSVEKAKKLIASGKGNQKGAFSDLEGDRGLTEIQAPAASYLTWFDPEGAMNSKNSAKRISANVPILWIVAKDDYGGLRQVNIPMFDLFPATPKTQFYEPPTNHQNAPLDAADEIIKWISEISNS
jgi:pimeloyl-ACP methyl ester carboxylesterase